MFDEHGTVQKANALLISIELTGTASRKWVQEERNVIAHLSTGENTAMLRDKVEQYCKVIPEIENPIADDARADECPDEASYCAESAPAVATDGSYCGFPVFRLGKAFDTVKDKVHWKNPIKAWVRKRDIKLFTAAVKFHTATELIVTDSTELYFQVESPGSGAGPAGDH